jgi:hypothetical protein
MSEQPTSDSNVIPTSLHYRNILAVLCLLASFGGCQILEPPSKSFDQSLASLGQFQLVFIDTYTAAQGKQWDDAKLRADINHGEAMFSTAMAGVADQKRMQALDILHRQFQKDYTFLQTRTKEGKPFFSVAAAQQKKLLIKLNYDFARKGELVRS